jgi:hypothetical protein
VVGSTICGRSVLFGEAYGRAAAESDDTIGLTDGELLHDTLSDLHRRMHGGIGRQMDTELTEDAHKTRRGGRCMMRIGENESPFAT